MATLVKVPDLGVEQAEVIELLVKPGDTVKKDQPIAVLESDKASLELPATEDGVLVSWSVKIGTMVKEGDDLLTFDAGQAAASGAEPKAKAAPAAAEAKASATSTSSSNAAVTQTAPAEKASPPQSAPAKLSAAVLVKVPDLGVEQAEVIELLVKKTHTRNKRTS